MEEGKVHSQSDESTVVASTTLDRCLTCAVEVHIGSSIAVAPLSLSVAVPTVCMTASHAARTCHCGPVFLL